MEYVLSTLIGMVVGAALVSFFLKKMREASSPDEKLQNLEEELRTIKKEKIELETKGKERYAMNQKLEAKNETLQQKNEELNREVTTFKTNEAALRKEHDKKMQEVSAMKDSFEEEKLRIRRADEERKKHQEEERDRLWAEHENSVIATLSDLCKQPQFGFPCYDNTHLPQGFHGKLKPDFLVEFLGQYVIFDAKVSKASNLQVYISEQVKKTAQKVKGEEQIYPTIYLVVPTIAAQELRKTSFYEEGFSFFVITSEALEPILASLKRIASYEFAQEMDPQQREHIVDMLAQLDFHISTRNTADYVLLQHGVETLNRVRELDPELAKEIVVKKEKIRHLNFNTAENKGLIANPVKVLEKLHALIEPTPKISQQEIDSLK
ncbi:MAG: hypothetical protein PHU04_03520 [Candidatus Peribacteraceae bacterium]|nr:hypothetical protein [Candidatus Peribacteraceae bacterium]